MVITRSTIVGGVFALLAGLFVITTPALVEDLDAANILIVQSPISGDLTVHTDPGWKFQGYGSVTLYPRRSEFKFTQGCAVTGAAADQKVDGHTNPGLAIRFYDGGNAVLCGSISWMMPLDPINVIAIHKDFRSYEAFELQAIRRSMESAATFSGPTMSSFESAAGRRNELLQIVNEQTINGVYKTLSKVVRAKDVAGVEKDMQVTEIVKDKDGIPIRAQESYVKKYHVTMLPMTISAFAYEKRVEDQIKEQQSATNAAVVAIANAKKADQDAITAEATGRANATKAEWEQKTIAAKTIADAQAKITIAQATVQEAEAFKKAEILRGQGEAERKRLNMEADGQLDKRLAALVEINKLYAGAIATANPGAWTPSIQMNGSGSGQAGNTADLLSLITGRTAAQVAKEVGVDLTTKAQPKK